MTQQRQVIFGVGPLGMAVMDELAAQGQTVVLVNRSGKVRETLPAGVTTAAADLNDPAQVRQLCADAQVVYLCAMPPYTDWPRLFPPLIKGLISGLTGSDARLVYGDNLYMYGPTTANHYEKICLTPPPVAKDGCGQKWRNNYWRRIRPVRSR